MVAAPRVFFGPLANVRPDRIQFNIPSTGGPMRFAFDDHCPETPVPQMSMKAVVPAVIMIIGYAYAFHDRC